MAHPAVAPDDAKLPEEQEPGDIVGLHERLAEFRQLTSPGRRDRDCNVLKVVLEGAECQAAVFALANWKLHENRCNQISCESCHAQDQQSQLNRRL